MKALPRIDGASLERFFREYEAPGEPVILTNAVSSWPAMRQWTPDHLLDALGSQVVHVSVNLPDSGTPYTANPRDHNVQIPFAELMSLIARGERAYLPQTKLATLGSLAEDVDFRPLIREHPIYEMNLWVGGATRSGLHFDTYNNFLVQVWGTKQVIMAAPRAIAFMHVFPDNPTKSQVDPEAPDLARFPRFAKAELHGGTLAPGDVLFIPRGWWHYLRARELSVSVNTWYGPELPIPDFARMVLRSGSTAVVKTLRDFVVHGVMGRRYAERLFSPPPLGWMLYRTLRAAIWGSTRHGKA